MELLEQRLELIKKNNPRFKALRFVNEAEALKLAKLRRDQAKRGEIVGRLHGIAFCVKDHIDVAGMPRSEGSAHRAEDRAAETAAAVQRLLAEGAICIGKSNMAEYGKSYFTENTAYGRTGNPHDPELSPGGSGGGDAAAVAAGFASFGVGADSGGSIRVPAAFCGVYGLYPTRGLVSEAQMSSRSHTITSLFRSVGPIASSLDDIEILLSAMEGFDERDPHSIASPRLDDTTARTTKQFGYFDTMNGVKASSEICSAIKDTVKKLEACGLKGEPVSPEPFARCYEIFIILAAQASLMIEDRLSAKAGFPRDLASEGSIMQNLRKRLANELPQLSAESLLEVWYMVDHLRHEIVPHLQKYDFFLTPVTATMPIKHGTTAYQIDGQSYQSQQVYQFASAPNVLGLPALAFPAGKSGTGLPIGLQLVGSRFSDRRLIKAVRDAGLGESAVMADGGKIAAVVAKALKKKAKS